MPAPARIDHRNVVSGVSEPDLHVVDVHDAQLVPGADDREAAQWRSAHLGVDLGVGERSRHRRLDVRDDEVAALPTGETGSHVLNDLQLGSYVFMDRVYADALATEEAPWRQALYVDTTVISANHDAFVTVDAGLKALATNAGPPVVAGHPERRYQWFGDEPT